jgi:hypothetical protein
MLRRRSGPVRRVVLLRRPGSGGQLVVERLPVADAASQELWPLRHFRQGISGFGQETPELGMVPAELMVRAVTVPTDTVPQADYLLHELAARERFEIVVHRRHASSLGGSGTENKVSAHSRRERGPEDQRSAATGAADRAGRRTDGRGRRADRKLTDSATGHATTKVRPIPSHRPARVRRSWGHHLIKTFWGWHDQTATRLHGQSWKDTPLDCRSKLGLLRR